jgi:hypothetical protein
MIQLLFPSKPMLFCLSGQLPISIGGTCFFLNPGTGGSHNPQFLFLNDYIMEIQRNELKKKIREREGVLNFFTKYQIPFTEEGYKILANELRDWKIELAVLENVLQETTYKMIKSN